MKEYIKLLINICEIMKKCLFSKNSKNKKKLLTKLSFCTAASKGVKSSFVRHITTVFGFDFVTVRLLYLFDVRELQKVPCRLVYFAGMYIKNGIIHFLGYVMKGTEPFQVSRGFDIVYPND
jgi:hypothetical protein